MGTFTPKVPIRAACPRYPTHVTNLRPRRLSWPTRRKWELSDSKFPRAILPRPARDSAGRGRALSLRGLSVRIDRRGPGQPGARPGAGSRPRGPLLRAQRPRRHGPADGGDCSAQRGGAVPRPVEARRHRGPLNAGRGGRAALKCLSRSTTHLPAASTQFAMRWGPSGNFRK